MAGKLLRSNGRIFVSQKKRLT